VGQYNKSVMAGTMKKQVHGRESEPFMRAGTRFPLAVGHEMPEKSLDTADVVHRVERAAVSSNKTRSRVKLNRENALVVPLAVNMSLLQASHRLVVCLICYLHISVLCLDRALLRPGRCPEISKVVLKSTPCPEYLQMS